MAELEVLTSLGEGGTFLFVDSVFWAGFLHPLKVTDYYGGTVLLQLCFLQVPRTQTRDQHDWIYLLWTRVWQGSGEFLRP